MSSLLGMAEKTFAGLQPTTVELRRHADQVARGAHDVVLRKRTFGRMKAPRRDGVLANVLGTDIAPPGLCKELGTTFLEPEYRYDGQAPLGEQVTATVSL